MRGSDQDELSLQQIQKTLKQKLFEITKDLLIICESINPFIIYFLILIQSLQILWFSIHPRLSFLSNPFLLQQFRSVLSYLQLQGIAASNNMLLLPFVGISSVFVFVQVCTIGLCIREIGKNSQHSEFGQVLIKIAAGQVVLMNSILFIPILNISLIGIWCDKKSPYYLSSTLTCYQSTHIGILFLSVLNILILLIQGLIFWFLFYIRNPFSCSYYALSNNMFRLGKMAIKIFLPAYFTIDSNLKLQNVFTIVSVVLFFAYFFLFRVNYSHPFEEKFFYFELFMEAFIFWFFINTALCFFLDSSNTNLIQACVCGLIFAYTICTVEKGLTQYFLEKNLLSNVKKQDKQRFTYAITRMLLKETPENAEISHIVFIKMLHAKFGLCCPKIEGFLQKMDVKTEETIQISRNLILQIIKKFLDETPSPNLKMCKSLILFDAGFKIFSLHQISQMRNDKLQVYQQFMLFYYKSTHQIYDKTELKSNDSNILEINKYLQYNELMNQFEYQLESCTKNNQEFWEELCQELPSVNKLFSLSENSIEYVVRVEEIYKKIVGIFPDNVISLNLYFHFLSNVCAKNKEFNRIQEKWKLQKQRKILKQNNDTDTKSGPIKFRSNQRMCVMHISTNSSTIGTITNCNSQVKNYLGYQKSQLINQKVTKIMPKLYIDIHDQFIMNYLEKADFIKLPIQKVVFAFRKDLMIVQTCLTVKIFPALAAGYQLIGFFKELKEPEPKLSLMLNMKTREIQGMTEGFLKLAGNRIKLQEIQKQPLKLSHLFPQIDPNHKFVKDEMVQTLFRFSDCTDKLIDLQQGSYQIHRKYDRNILLKLESLNTYPEVSIGILTVKQTKTDVSLKQIKSEVKSKIVHHRISVVPLKRESSCIADDSQRKQINVQRKMEDFLNSKSHLLQMYILRIVFFSFILVLTVVSIFVTLFMGDDMTIHKQVLTQIGAANNITIIQGKLISSNIYLFQSSNSTSEQWTQIHQACTLYTKQLQNQLATLFQNSNKLNLRDQQLIINGAQLYSFNQYVPANMNPQHEDFHYYDGMLYTVFTYFDMLKKPMQDFNPPTEDVKTAAFFVQENMKKMLPDLGFQTVLAFSVYFEKLITSQLFSNAYFIIGKSLGYLVMYIITYIVIVKFSQFNSLLVDIYNSILKNDTYQIYLKCKKFRIEILGSMFQTMQNQPTSASQLFNIISNSIPLQHLDPHQDNSQFQQLNKHSQHNKNSQKSGFHNQNQNVCEKQPLITIEYSEQGATPSIRGQGLNKNDYVNIKLHISLRKNFLWILGLLFVLLSVDSAALYFKNYYNSTLLAERTNAVNLAHFTKNFLFTYFYGKSFLINKSNQFKILYRQELNDFYVMGTTVTGLIGDPIKYKRDVYQQIQLLNSIMINQLPATKQALQDCKTKLFSLADQISTLSIERQQKNLSQLDSLSKVIKTLKILLDLIFTLIFCLLTNLHLLKRSDAQLKYSFDMIKMIPMCLVSKNSRIKNILFAVNQEKESNNKIQESAMSLTASNMQLS